MLGIDSNLDHISAQNPSSGSRLRAVHNIGNLVPIDKVSNSKLGNKAIEEKVEVYKTIQNITLVRNTVEFLEKHNWVLDDSTIDERATELAKLSYGEVWKI